MSARSRSRRECDGFPVPITRAVCPPICAPVGIVLAPAGVDQYIAAHTPAQFLQALVERRKSVLAFWVVRSPVHEHANPPQTFRLLRARRERPRNRCAAAEQRDEVASPHSITSLARAPAMWP